MALQNEPCEATQLMVDISQPPRTLLQLPQMLLRRWVTPGQPSNVCCGSSTSKEAARQADALDSCISVNTRAGSFFL